MTTLERHRLYTSNCSGIPCATVPLPPGYGEPCYEVVPTGDNAPGRGLLWGISLSLLLWALILSGVAALVGVWS